MRKVYDYKDLRRLEESTIYNKLQQGIIITATTDLAEEVGNYYPMPNGLLTIDMHSVTASIVEVWDTKVKNILNFVTLRNIIERFIEENDLSMIHRAYLRRNAVDIWNSIILLVEADIYPEDIPDNVSPPIRDFKNLWKMIEMENTAFMQFRSSFMFELTDRDQLDKLLPEIVKGREIFLLGFYFITPIQARIIAALESAGYKINYLNGYDKKHPYFFEIWERTFEEEYKSGVTIDIQPDIQHRNYFVSCVEEPSGSKADFITVDAYKTDIEFATACINAKRSGASLYTTDAKRTDNLLREFFPEEYDDKHLLSYPVGQYIYYLHMMWNEFIEEPELQFEYVFKCFASGWLEEDGINGKDYLYQLKVLEPYFKDCNSKGRDSFEEWKNRTETLIEAKKVTSVFNEGNDSRWKKLMGNPFEKLAIYQLKENDIEVIVQLLNRLMADADELFSGDIIKNLHLHMKKIKKVIESHADKDDVTEDEQLVMKELLDRLDNTGSEGRVCHLNGIKDAIILLIGGHDNAEESHEEETLGKKRLVKPISMVETSSLENIGQDIYLVMADEFLLPGKQRKLPWPLNDELVKTMIEKLATSRPDSASYLMAMTSLIETRPLAYRYLFYSLFDNVTEKNKPNIHLNWLVKQGDKDVAPSPYISLLGWTKEEVLNSKDKGLEERIQTKMMAYIDDSAIVKGYCIPAPDNSVPQEVLGDYALCKVRYLYSYVLNELPSFNSEFHYAFVLSKLVSAFASISGEDKTIIKKHVSELFPFLRNVVKQQAADYAYVYKSDGCELDGIMYTGNRLDVHYLQDFIKETAESNALALFENGELSWQINSEHCKYCPYTNICRVKFEGVDKYES